MAKVTIKLNSANIARLLKSDAVKSDLQRRAEAIAASAGDGFVAESSVGRNRARAAVFTDTPEAMIAESEGHALSGAIDAGR